MATDVSAGFYNPDSLFTIKRTKITEQQSPLEYSSSVWRSMGVVFAANWLGHQYAWAAIPGDSAILETTFITLLFDRPLDMAINWLLVNKGTDEELERLPLERQAVRIAIRALACIATHLVLRAFLGLPVTLASVKVFTVCMAKMTVLTTTAITALMFTKEFCTWAYDSLLDMANN